MHYSSSWTTKTCPFNGVYPERSRMGSGQALSNAEESKISINSILLLSDYNVAAHQRRVCGVRVQPLVRYSILVGYKPTLQSHRFVKLCAQGKFISLLLNFIFFIRKAVQTLISSTQGPLVPPALLQQRCPSSTSIHLQDSELLQRKD